MKKSLTQQTKQATNHWALWDIVVPVLLTRSLLLLVGWFSQYFSPAKDYFSQEIVQRGWEFSPLRLLDIWGRWDTGWYYSIIREGYMVRGDLSIVQSNIAFYPLYPLIVKFIAAFHPDSLMTDQGLLVIGVIVSNLFLMGGLYFVYKLALILFKDVRVAQLTVWYLLLFPTGFFFSAMYTEATFLFFSAATLYFTYSKNWFWAGLMGFLAALTRNVGIFLTVPMMFHYWHTHHDTFGFNFRRLLTPNAISLALPGLGLLLFMLYTYSLSGDLLASVHVQAAWNRQLSLPWDTFLSPNNFRLFLSPLEKLLVILTAIFSIAALFLQPYLGLAIYGILLLLSPLLTGSLNSITRYTVVAIPLFIFLAQLTKEKPRLQVAIMMSLAVVQILFFIGWSQFYWVG